jgi:APA family basic amino acid/polyamine antiporter
VLTALTYAAVAGVTLGTLGASRLAASRAPLMDAAQIFLGSWAGPVILIAAATAIGTTLNGVFLIFTRYLFAMGRSGVLPSALGRIHPVWGTPHVATAVAFACCVLGLLLPQNLVFLFLAVNIPTMLKYSGACLAAIRLVDTAPDLHEQAHFRLSRRSVRLWSYLGVLCGISIVLIGLTADWRPYAVLVVWAVAGTIYWRCRSQAGVLVPSADGKVPVR